MSLEQMVLQFNHTYRVPTSSVPRLPDAHEASRIYTLITEELQETKAELDNQKLPELAKELTDILYVTAQQMAVLGLPIDALLREVQRSNMSKLDVDGEPIFRHDGKVLKGPNYSPANTIKVLKENGFWIVGTSLENAKPYTEVDFTIPIALIVGNEEKGIRKLTADKCDFLVKIPMTGKLQSLNVSVATGILLFEVLRQRGEVD